VVACALVLEGLFITPAVTAISQALSSAGVDGPVVVIGHAKLATALSSSREVIAVGLSERAARKLRTAIADTHSLESGSVAAVIGPDITTDSAWDATLREWTRLVRDGGTVVLVDRGQAAEASRRALCAGLTDIQQRHTGRTILTSGLVTHL
jgi:D-arabinose 1-dehydrogenase-like Zn-dependent alcohol dehydrogenase